MKSSILIATTIFIFLCATITAKAAPPATAPANLGENAALDYWEALRTIIAFDQKSRELVDDHFDTAPLDEAIKLNLVNDRSTPIKYLRFGAKRPWCDWGLHIDEEGFGALLPYLSYARTLGKLGLLRARVELRDRHWSAAVEDWIAVLALGRHCGCDNLGVSMMVGYGIEDFTIQQAASQLMRLDKPALDQLLQSLDALPPGGDITESVHDYQRAGQKWLIRKIGESKGDQWEQGLDLTWVLNLTPEQIHAAVQACGGTPQAVIEKLRALDPLYDEQAQAVSLPYDRFQRDYPPMLARMKASPAYPLVPADFSRVYQQTAYARARMSLFRAAIVIVRDGPDAAKTTKDPFGDGPLVYRAVPGGFELSSRLLGKDGQPLTLKLMDN